VPTSLYAQSAGTAGNGHAPELKLQQPAVDAEALKVLDLKRGSAAGPAQNVGCS
jgi:hypothetical protein